MGLSIGFAKTSASLLERMAGTTGLEPATAAVTATIWKSTDGTASHWKYVVDNVIVYRDVRLPFKRFHDQDLRREPTRELECAHGPAAKEDWT